jgi:CcmD family protein
VTAAEKYVAAAYLVVFVLVLAYVLIIALKLQRLERAIQDLSIREARADEPALEIRPTAYERGRRDAIEAQMR